MFLPPSDVHSKDVVSEVDGEGVPGLSSPLFADFSLLALKSTVGEKRTYLF
jgi:hypothetical protein